eukprot:363076-Chlamydomonas_euryale.AAC.6
MVQLEKLVHRRVPATAAMQAAPPAGRPAAMLLALALALAVWVAPGQVAASETVELSAGSDGCLAAPPNPPRGAVVKEKVWPRGLGRGHERLVFVAAAVMVHRRQTDKRASSTLRNEPLTH